MKNTTINAVLFAALLLVGCGKQQGEAATDQAIPDVVVRSFQATNPEVKDAIWQKEEEGFEAEWKVNGMERGITYNENGEVLITEEQVQEAEMPAAITSYLAENPAELRIVKVGKDIEGGITRYEVELDNAGQELELVFDAQGNLLGEEADDQDNEQDQD